MKYFDRLCIIDISPDLRIQDLKIKFEITKSIKSESNSAKIEIYNLSQNTRKRIVSDQLVKVLAGYKEAYGYIEIGQGDISNVVHSSSSPDIITTIYTKDGLKAVRGNVISLSFDVKTPLSSVLAAIQSKLGLPLKFSGIDKTANLKKGYSFIGSVSTALEDLSTQFNFTWSIQNGQLQILSKNKGTGKEVVVLSASTGLIEAPEKKIDSKKDLNSTPDTYKITALLQPQLEVGDNIRIESKFLSGVFLINNFTHTGDTRGQEWYTEIEVAR